MEDCAERSDQNVDGTPSPQKKRITEGLEREMAWLKKDSRACHFFLFWLTTSLSECAKQSVSRQVENDVGLSEAQKWVYSLMSDFNGPLRQAEGRDLPPSPEYPEALMPQFNNDFDIETVNENSAPLDDSLMENAGANDDKKVADGKNDDKLPSAELILANGISNARLAKSTIIRNSFYGVIMELSFRHYSNKQTLKLIFEITSMWTVQRKRFPSPFSWLNSKNQSHCQWLWDEMHKRCVGIPFHAKDQTQQWCFIIATFDHWKGWTLAQEEYLQEKNPKRKPGKFLSSGLDPSEREIEHKKLLLDELKKAWDQKERRAKKAKEPAAVRLTKADQKKLQFISGIEGTTSKDILSEMIDNAYNDAKRKARQL